MKFHRKKKLKGVIPVILSIKKKFPGIEVSCDTTKYEVANAAIAEGADIINDISG